MKILYTAALKKEISPIKKRISSEDFVENHKFDFLKLKVGAKNASTKLKNRLLKNDYDYIINAGSAASIDKKLKIGDIVFVNKFISEHNPKLFGEFSQNLQVLIDNQSWQTCKLFTSPNPVLTTEHKNDIKKKYNAECIDMEGAILAEIAQKHNIPFFSIKVITDTGDIKTRADFLQRLRQYYSPVPSAVSKLTNFLLNHKEKNV